MKTGTKLRIWLEDLVQPEGGIWCYGEVDDDGMFRENNFDHTDKEDDLDTPEQFIEWGYIVEEI